MFDKNEVGILRFDNLGRIFAAGFSEQKFKRGRVRGKHLRALRSGSLPHYQPATSCIQIGRPFDLSSRCSSPLRHYFGGYVGLLSLLSKLERDSTRAQALAKWGAIQSTEATLSSMKGSVLTSCLTWMASWYAAQSSE